MTHEGPESITKHPASSSLMGLFLCRICFRFYETFAEQVQLEPPDGLRGHHTTIWSPKVKSIERTLDDARPALDAILNLNESRRVTTSVDFDHVGGTDRPTNADIRAETFVQ